MAPLRRTWVAPLGRSSTKLTPADILDRKLILNDTKSGKEQELIFIPQKVADRLKEYVRAINVGPNKKIFPIC